MPEQTADARFEEEYKKNPDIVSWTGEKLAKLLGCGATSARNARRLYLENNDVPNVQKKHGAYIDDSDTYKEIRHGDIIDITDVIEKRLTDDELFKRYNRTRDKWRISNVYFKDKSGGRVYLTVQFISLVKSETAEIIENIKEEIKKYAPKYPKVVYEKNHNKPILLEISIYDLHYGKLCWSPETGNDYDSKIAHKRFNDALVDIVSRAKAVYNIEKILFVINQDLLNADGKSNATTAGTPQDNDSRWKKIYVGCRSMLVNGIEYLMQAAPVDVVSIEGNHAEQAEFYLADALECWFHNCKDVTINNKPRVRKYYPYGNSLIGFTHGHLEKTKDLPLLMASEVPDMWAKARFREFHCGHLHHERELVFNTTVENKSVVVRHLSSLSGTDSWHTGAGYVGQKLSTQAFVWGKENGIENIYYHTISLR